MKVYDVDEPSPQKALELIEFSHLFGCEQRGVVQGGTDCIISVEIDAAYRP